VRYDEVDETRGGARADAPDGGAPRPGGFVPLPEPVMLPVPAALPLAIVRPLTRRRHERVPGATAGAVERLGLGPGDAGPEPVEVGAAVSVVPASSRSATRRATRSPSRRPRVLPVLTVPLGGADLDSVVGEEEAGCAPGRHRQDAAVWRLLRLVPGWRPSPPAWDVDPDGADDPDDLDELVDTAELPAVPAPRPAGVPAQRRRRREAVPAVRAALLAARARIDAAEGPLAVARTTAEEAARLTGADVAALVLRGVDGPRVLALHPGGPDSDDLWGPATLAALLGLGQPVRRIVEDDPLADGDATALLAVPVPSGGAVVGSLLVRRHVARAFGGGDQDVLGRLARMAGAVLALPADAGGVPSTAPGAPGGPSTDPVTGLPGARRLAADVVAAVRTAERQRIPVTVLAAHLDGLARLREDLGDEAADDVLRMLARALAELLRVGDVAYRIGVDEVALLLPASDDEAVPTVRERLEEIAADLPAAAGLPGNAPRLRLLTAQVALDSLREGADAVDAALAALGVAPQRVRWVAAGS
jgi:diguanylate cyclase (GGDEF)-like protein